MIEQCPKCNSQLIVKGGIRQNKYTLIQKYKCKDCGTCFSNSSRFRGKFDIKLVKFAVSLYLRGNSCRRVAFLLEKSGHKVSYMSIWNWVKELGYLTRKRNSSILIKESIVLTELIELGVLTKVRILTSNNSTKKITLEMETKNIIRI